MISIAQIVKKMKKNSLRLSFTEMDGIWIKMLSRRQK